uniref:Uncharacterized protein n=1 Tax=Glossina palpalis gambiensis TaxID=67801 RepID=A0A1B0BU05_9MUSC
MNSVLKGFPECLQADMCLHLNQFQANADVEASDADALIVSLLVSTVLIKRFVCIDSTLSKI